MHETTKTPLRVCTFKGSQNIALYVAKQQGFFATYLRASASTTLALRCGTCHSSAEYDAAEPALRLDVATATHTYKALIDPIVGFGREGKLTEAGLQQVIDLRAAYGSPPKPLGKPEKYQDLRWYYQAIERTKI